MTYERPSKSLKEMTAAERAAHYAAVDAEVTKVASALADDFNRRQQQRQQNDQMLWDYLKWAGAGKRCMLFVRHPHHSTKGSMVSRAGDASEQFFLPDSQCEVRPQSTDKFLLVIVSRFIRSKMPAGWATAGAYSTPELTGTDWSDADREVWTGLVSLCWKIEYEIDMAPRRLRRGSSTSLSITNCISPGNAA